MFRNATSLSSSTTQPNTTLTTGGGGGDPSTASGVTSGLDGIRSNKSESTSGLATPTIDGYTQRTSASPNSPGGNNNPHTPQAKTTYENLLSVSSTSGHMSGQPATPIQTNHEGLHQMNNATSPPNYLASSLPNLGQPTGGSPSNSYHTLNQTTM